MPDVSVTFFLDEKLRNAVEGVAQEQQRTLSGQIRFILEKWLETNE